MDLNLALGLGGDVLELALGFPVLEALGNELGFDAALQKKLIDAEELFAQALVVDITFDGGQRRPEPLLNRKKRGWH